MDELAAKREGREKMAAADLGTIWVPVVPSVDSEVLDSLGEQIRATVAQSVLDGIRDGVAAAQTEGLM